MARGPVQVSREDYDSHHPHALPLAGQGSSKRRPGLPGQNPPQTRQWHKGGNRPARPEGPQHPSCPAAGERQERRGKRWAMGFVVRPTTRSGRGREDAKNGENPQSVEARDRSPERKAGGRSLLQPASPDGHRYLPAQASRGPRRTGRHGRQPSTPRAAPGGDATAHARVTSHHSSSPFLLKPRPPARKDMRSFRRLEAVGWHGGRFSFLPQMRVRQFHVFFICRYIYIYVCM